MHITKPTNYDYVECENIPTIRQQPNTNNLNKSDLPDITLILLMPYYSLKLPVTKITINGLHPLYT